MGTGLLCFYEALTGNGAIAHCLERISDGISTTELTVWVIVLAGASISSIAGFAFAGIAGALLFHVTQDKLYTLQVILVASVALQSYSVWKLRHAIEPRRLIPYFAGGMATIVPGVYLFLSLRGSIHLLSLGLFLVAYAAFMLMRPNVRFRQDSLLGQITSGALGGITGATAAFPGAFVTIWCSGQGWDKERQRAIYQPFILGMQVLTLAAFAFVQPWNAPRLELLQYAVPAVIGAFVGLRVFYYLNNTQFHRVIGAFLLVSGIALSAKGLVQ